MRQCQECGRQSSLLRHYTADICEDCDAAIESEVHDHVVVIKSELDQLEYEKSLQIKLRQWARILDEVEVLFRYEQRGIFTTHPRPSILHLEYRAEREALVRAAQAGKQDPWRGATGEGASSLSAPA